MTTKPLMWKATALQDLDFADKLALLCHSFGDQRELTDELRWTAGTAGLHINTSKTKLMNVNVGEGTETLKF